VMNSAARLVFSSSRYNHITPFLRQLHWLKAAERIDFKLAVLVYKCLHGAAPSYLADKLCPSADHSPRRRLRSAPSSSLVVCRTRLSTIGDRAFPVFAAHVWNGLPQHVTSPFSLYIKFRRRLNASLPVLLPFTACVVPEQCFGIFGHVNRSFYSLTSYSVATVCRSVCLSRS